MLKLDELSNQVAELQKALGELRRP
jgi:hypothetical protein